MGVLSQRDGDDEGGDEKSNEKSIRRFTVPVSGAVESCTEHQYDGFSDLYIVLMCSNFHSSIRSSQLSSFISPM